MINFLKYRTLSFSLFALIVVVSVLLYVVRGGFNYSVDFTGGTQVILNFKKSVTSVEVRDILKNAGWADVSVSEFDSNDLRVRTQDISVEAVGLGEKMKDVLEKTLPENVVTVLQSDNVSESIGKTLVWSAVKALLIALLAMMAYIFIVFRLSFALGAVIALIHDAFAVGLVFLALNWEVSIDVIAALLMILGYSINDTIVIFARIRESLANVHKSDVLEDVVNGAINQTLRRTLLTSFSTLLVVLSLLFLGGEALRNLSFALFLGIIFGTYSSIFIASPFMLMFYKKKLAGRSSEKQHIAS
jgi:preprotein translocase subunit SecF